MDDVPSEQVTLKKRIQEALGMHASRTVASGRSRQASPTVFGMEEWLQGRALDAKHPGLRGLEFPASISAMTLWL